MKASPLPAAAVALFVGAFVCAELCWASEGSSDALTVSRAGSHASAKGSPQFFTGAVRVDLLHAAREPWRASSAYVTFEPGARSAWHTHPLGQTLIVTAGVGRVQRWGSAVEAIRPGDVVWIPAGVKHWHGAAPRTGMTHLAITETLNGKNVDWLEQVGEEQYAR